MKNIISLKRYCIFFIFFYIQAINISGIKISYVTFGLIYIYIVFKLLHNSISNKSDSIGNSSFFYPIKSFIFLGESYSSINTIVNFLAEANFFFIYKYSVNFLKRSVLLKWVLELSIFFILSFIPFIIKIVNPINSGYELNLFSNGEESDNLSSYIGIFENSHSAAVTISLSLLIVSYTLFFKPQTWRLNDQKNFFLNFVFILGVFVLYKTYIRTGFIMFLGGIFMMILCSITKKNLPKIFLVVLLSILALVFIVNNDQTLNNRIFDHTEYSSGSSKDLGSGRVVFQLAALKIWGDGDVGQKIFGIGFEDFLNKMYGIVGLRIYSHNGFTSQLVRNGIFGLTLFCLFITTLFYRSIKCNYEEKILYLGISVAYLFYQLVQGGVICPEMEVLLGLIYASTFRKKVKSLTNKQREPGLKFYENKIDIKQIF